MSKGYLCFILHAHLPFIRHPEYKSFMEENWFFEAIIETYIPLLKVFQSLVNDNINYKITISISPSLCEMFSDQLLQERFLNNLKKLIELSEKEIIRTKNTDYYKIAKLYNERLIDSYNLFLNKYNKNLINGFKYFQEIGKIELITCGATHAFIPLLNNINSINAQIEIAVKNYYKYFGCYPKGIWNSECAYYPGIEEIFEKWGIKYFFVDTHGILYAHKKPKYGIFAPIYCENKVAVFGRDIESSKQVWSATEGYPGDPLYRDFYRDIGFDLPLDYINPYLFVNNIRMMTGFKYHRITGKNIEKIYYDPDLAIKKVMSHALDFKDKREKQIKKLNKIMDRKPIIVAPYDAELFGHWWFEGPEFINFICREIFNSSIVEMITPMEYLNEYPDNQVSIPSLSTWGSKGYMGVWLNESNDWIYRYLHECADKMIEMTNKYPDTKNKIFKRILNQMARELLIAQTSCWAFIISTGTTVEYANKKIKTHIHRFISLYNMLNEKKINNKLLKEYELRDNIFNEIDYMAFSDNHLKN